MGHLFKVSSERLEKPWVELKTPGLQGEQLYHYTTEASNQLKIQTEMPNHWVICIKIHMEWQTLKTLIRNI